MSRYPNRLTTPNTRLWLAVAARSNVPSQELIGIPMAERLLAVSDRNESNSDAGKSVAIESECEPRGAEQGVPGQEEATDPEHQSQPQRATPYKGRLG